MTDGPLRAFSFSLDVRSFQAGRRLPFNTANTYVQATLPAGLLGVCMSECVRVCVCVCMIECVCVCV
jgi:hypothetical protein